MKEIVVLIDNRVGALASVCEKLGGSGINIDSISAYGLGDKGVIRLVTADETSALSVLKKENLQVLSAELLIVKVNDQPGEIGKIARRLATHQINIESIYLLSKNKGTLEFAIKTNEPDKARAALKH